MSDLALRIDGLSKQYRLGQHEPYRALRDVIASAAMTPFYRLRSAMSSTNGNGQKHARTPDSRPEMIWALDDVSFEVKQGEVVGIIGRNGAGKSTLLKILSRITKPTRGSAMIHGRVGSLLEVGTGFHPELSGRENVYLNGAILGMRKAEIVRQFDQIVAFAEVEQFIDTPVKRYSTGMHVRLAFAVAAHLEPEILLVDEVLSVGDAAFQKKCLGKIGEVAKGGRTVLFVSHNMAAVQSLCRRAILLEQGRVRADGGCPDVVSSYLEPSLANSAAMTSLRAHPNREPGLTPILSSVTIMDGTGRPVSAIFPGDDLILEFELKADAPIINPVMGIGFDNALGLRVFSVMTVLSKCDWKKLEGTATVRCIIPRVNLAPGRYFISPSAGNTYQTLIDNIPRAASFNVESNDYFGSGRMPGLDLGVVLAQSRWEFPER